MQGARTVRVAQAIRQVLMETLLRGEVKDPRVTDQGLLTITHVEVSGDLRHARVGFVLHEGDAERARQGLMAARGFLRRLVGRHLGAKTTPELEFRIDPGYEEGDKIERLLAEVAAEERERSR